MPRTRLKRPGQTVLFRYPSLPSTNDEAIRLVRSLRPPEGSVVVAADQTAGKGQQSNTWYSEPGTNITCSFIFYPTRNNPEQAFLLNMAIALAAADCIAWLSDGKPVLAPSIKWPNDILCSERKVAGILLENIWQAQRWDACVAGIGMNVNQQAFGEVSGAASLSSLSGGLFSLDTVLSRLQTAVKARYRQWEQQPDIVLNDYNSMLWRRGLESGFVFDDGTIRRCLLESVDRHGCACIRAAEGKTECHPHGKIRQMR